MPPLFNTPQPVIMPAPGLPVGSAIASGIATGAGQVLADRALTWFARRGLQNGYSGSGFPPGVYGTVTPPGVSGVSVEAAKPYLSQALTTFASAHGITIEQAKAYFAQGLVTPGS